MPQAPSESERVRLSCRVLVVDDDPLVLNNTAAMLEDLGCSVLKADSGSLALEILTATPELDILLTDQAMPRMNGSQLVERVMAQGRPLKMALATGFAEKIEGAAAQLPAGQAVRPGRVVPVPDRHAEGRLSLSAGTRRCRPGFAPRTR